MAKKKVELVFPDQKPESIARETLVFATVQAFMMVDQNKDLLEEGIDPAYSEVMIETLTAQLEDLATIISIQNSVTGEEFDVAEMLLEKAYAEAAEIDDEEDGEQ